MKGMRIVVLCFTVAVFLFCCRSKQDESVVDSILNVDAESVDSVFVFHQQRKKRFVVNDKSLIAEFSRCLNNASPISLEHPYARESMDCTLYIDKQILQFWLVVSTDSINGTFISITNEDGWNLGAYRNDDFEIIVSKIIDR